MKVATKGTMVTKRRDVEVVTPQNSNRGRNRCRALVNKSHECTRLRTLSYHNL
ncbi:hypothetical protein SLEP1_g13316 [Rubroshorea leprosula]|uniref:Uncharacterized protein n=1 Tax=Rubroshorea leprosula TaxID=152421 RepID=A0AAV5IRU6_9ROSI|nr:hypothetical protein SLEP1_g13316 [Rubroshorea leprosula]